VDNMDNKKNCRDKQEQQIVENIIKIMMDLLSCYNVILKKYKKFLKHGVFNINYTYYYMDLFNTFCFK
jgi:hypothetical protein